MSIKSPPSIKAYEDSENDIFSPFSPEFKMKHSVSFSTAESISDYFIRNE